MISFYRKNANVKFTSHGLASSTYVNPCTQSYSVYQQPCL